MICLFAGTQSKFNHRIITISLAKKFHSNSSAKREARIETGSPTTILTIVLIKILRILRIFLHPLFRRLISFSCILIFIFTTRYCPAVFSPLLSNSSTTISITQSTSTWYSLHFAHFSIFISLCCLGKNKETRTILCAAGKRSESREEI